MLGGECLVDVVKSLYNVHISSQGETSQVFAKAVLVQILLIVFARVEADAMEVEVRTISSAEVLELSDKKSSHLSIAQFVHNVIYEVTDGSEGKNSSLKSRDREVSVDGVERKCYTGNDKAVDDGNSGKESKIRDDGLFLFKNLCKFSMKFSTPENPEDHLLLQGKVLSLELLKIVIDNAGQIWRTDEKFLGCIKQYLCLSLLKNSALSATNIFQLLCSIFTLLVSRFRSGLKGEIGIFFPMLVLRVLENVLQPSFLQKLTVLNLLEKTFQDPQIAIDLFVNYDCDIDEPNLFERTINGLLKTTLGVPPGSATTLSPAQDTTLRIESVKCLACIIKSMGTWMNQQLHIGEFTVRCPEIDTQAERAISGEDGTEMDYELQFGVNLESIEDLTLEQQLAYKMEFQKGISLFNRKPYKGIHFLISTKKLGGTPEEVASFLRNASGLNETMIGEYLGDGEDFSLKVMHAYVDSFNFRGMNFGEAITFFLCALRLPGEAQKTDIILEKFAEHYYKCNPSSFSNAGTAFVLAYSVIMLHTIAQNRMVKDEISKEDFIHNNQGIDDGHDLPEDYLGSLYDYIIKNKIKIKADSSVPQQMQHNSFNKLLGLGNILNWVTWKQAEEKPLDTNGMLIRHIQNQFKTNTGKSEHIFYAVTDATILRYMMEVCWAPMMAAYSVTLDQSDDKAATSECLLGFRYAVHVTSVMCMQTQRDAFVTSVAKLTHLHNAAGMKQKNVDMVKAIISIAIEDGNYLQEAWEHVLTCLSRFEYLQLLGEGAPSDASFFTVPIIETEEKSQKSPARHSLSKKTLALQNPAMMAAVRGGSYDSATPGINALGLVTTEHINNFVSNLNLLDHIGSFELNHIFAHSQRLNGEAIIDFVKALCKVSMGEMQSPTDPRVFSLTRIVEIAHYNMNRIRLVWSHIWNVLSDFFVTVGISANLSVAIFVIDSLRQLAMKFLEREELANYNFQNEFLRPFVIVMQKSTSVEIRELVVRCISQIVSTHVSNLKSGWRSVFMVLITASADERKNIVLLAFETMEKIIQDYFAYMTKSETMIFNDCVRCLFSFTNSKFDTDITLNSIRLLQICALKLAEEGLICQNKNMECNSVNGDALVGDTFTESDDYIHFWVPVLAGLSRLTSDYRSAVRKGALEALFHILSDHGHLFPYSIWMNIFKTVIFPIFSDARIMDNSLCSSHMNGPAEYVEDTFSSETQQMAAQCLVDLYVSFFDAVRLLLPDIVSILMIFIRSLCHSCTSIGVDALLYLTRNLSEELSEKEWSVILMSLKEAALLTLPEFTNIVREMEQIEIPEVAQGNSDAELNSENELMHSVVEENDMEAASNTLFRLEGHIAVELTLVEAVTSLYEAHLKFFSSSDVKILLEILSSIASHSSEVNLETGLRQKLQRACTHLDVPEPPLVHFETESYENYVRLLQNLLVDNPSISEENGVDHQLVAVCEKILHVYLNCAGCQPTQVPDSWRTLHGLLPLDATKKEEVAARTSLSVHVLRVLNSLEEESFKKCISRLFPLLVNLNRCEHSSGEVQHVLGLLFQSSIGPIIMSS